MLQIQDAVAGQIEPTDIELSIIEIPAMQRMRHIKQTGFAYLTYPGANHTRFEHSLGTMLVTRQIVSQTMNKSMEELECAGLLHDVGHAAFSHSTDGLLKRYLNTNHEKLGEKIIKTTSIRDILQKSSLSMKKVVDYFNGIGDGQIVTGALGSDRLDYLSRDSYYTGVAYGTMDFEYIRGMLTVYKGKPAVFEKGIGSVESLLMARHSMYSSVYHHHTTLIAQGMYEHAVANAIDSGKMQKDELTYLNDWEMFSRLGSIKASEELTKRLLERRLFKRAYFDYVAKQPKIPELERVIEKTGLKSGDYAIIFMPVKPSEAEEINVMGRDGGLIGKLSEISPLVKTLTTAIDKRERLLVACDKKNVKTVGAAVKKLL